MSGVELNQKVAFQKIFTFLLFDIFKLKKILSSVYACDLKKLEELV